MAFRAITTAALLIAVMTIPATAKPTVYVPLTLSVAKATVARIPPKYDPDRVGYPEAIVHYLPRKRIWELCGKRTYACKFQRKADMWPQIVIDIAYKGTVLDHYLRQYEFAHVLGWWEKWDVGHYKP